jgi:beta-glucanase (GH16 family)
VDDFDSSELISANWVRHDQELVHTLSSRSAKNVFVRDGVLHLPVTFQSGRWFGGGVFSRRAFKYGLFLARYKYAPIEGGNSSFWIMPEKKLRGDKNVFEIDINEGKLPDLVDTNMHFYQSKLHSTMKRFKSRDLPGESLHHGREYNEFGLYWGFYNLIWFVNGHVVRVERNTHMHEYGNVWVTFAILNTGDKPTFSDVGKSMLVDYVSIQSPADKIVE